MDNRPRPEDLAAVRLDQDILTNRLYRSNGRKFNSLEEHRTLSRQDMEYQRFHHSNNDNRESKEREKQSEPVKLVVSEEQRSKLVQRPPEDTRPAEVEVPSILHLLLGARKHARLPIIHASKNGKKLPFKSQLPGSKQALLELKKSLTSAQLEGLKHVEFLHENDHENDREKTTDVQFTQQHRSQSVQTNNDEKEEYASYLKSPFSFIDKVIESPYTEEFVYLRALGPYNLEIIKHNEISSENYYTMSRAGVTHFYQTETDFTSLDQWEREYFLFTKMMQIPFFSRFRMWKGFFFWKKLIRRTKTSKCCKFLNENLYILNPYLRGSLIQLRKECYATGRWTIFRVDAKATLTLTDFKVAQNQQKMTVFQNLEELNQKVRTIVLKACDVDLRQFLVQNGFRKSRKEDDTLDDLESDDYRQKISHAEKAAMRTKCRKLIKYIRLADYFIINSLMSLTMDRTAELLMFVERRSPLQLESMKEAKENKNEHSRNLRNVAQKDSKNQAKPLFSVELDLDEDNETLVFVPPLAEFQASIESAIDSAVRKVMSPKRLIADPEFAQYTDENIDDGEEAVTYAKLEQMVLTDDKFIEIKRRIKKGLNAAFAEAVAYAKTFENVRETYFENKRTDINVYEGAKIDQFSSLVKKYTQQIEMISQLPTQATIGIVLVDSSRLKRNLIPSPKRCMDDLALLLPRVARQKTDVLLEELKLANAAISDIPATVDEFVRIMDVLAKVQDNEENVMHRHKFIDDLFMLMKDHGIRCTEEDFTQFDRLNQTRSAFKTSVLLAEASINSNTERFSKELDAEIPVLRKNISNIMDGLMDEKYQDVNTAAEVVIPSLQEYEDTLVSLEETAKKYMKYQEVLQVDVMSYDLVQKARLDMDIKFKLWTSLHTWSSFAEDQESQRVDEIDVDDISHQVQEYNKTCAKAKRMLEGNPVVGLLKSKVKIFQDTLPIVVDLRNKHLQDRHWKAINELLGHDVRNDENFTLGMLIDIDATEHKTDIAIVSNKARQEAALQEMLDRVIETWAKLSFPLNHYKDHQDIYVLGNLDEIITALDESLVTVGTILGSPFVEPIRERVIEWNDKLLLFQDTLEEWTTCQRSWLYLETIFTSQDIVRQLMDEATEFNKVDRGWKEIMRRTRDMENAITAGTYSGLRDMFVSFNEKLDKIQKALEAYLETKRNLFPRFYFLANEELLKLLAQAKDPLKVQPHLCKCFDNIVALKFVDKDIKAMYSSEGECVPLGMNLKARMNVEIWLASLENDMVKSLKKYMKKGVIDYGRMEVRGDWVLQKFGQVVMTVSQIAWCRGCEQAINDRDSSFALSKWHEQQLKQLSELTALIRTNLDKIQRRKIVALITTDVHGRDVTRKLMDEKVSHLNNFTWQQQLRFYWDTTDDDCIVRQANAEFNYGYEYMGVTSRLVITPLTDRCWMTITGALHIRFGASPAGPAGTGKTESTKDLAKAMGFFCVVFNCSEQVNYQIMSKLFSGLAQTGAWTCLDEFNRIDIEVLSVIAQQLLQVRQALLQNLTSFSFQGKKHITLKSTFGVMITMNPGYAGRTELPDNLKVLFRPVAMMIPDYAAIAEIMLYAEGFDTASTLSKKMVKLYKLSSEQLSQQDHYDFGMRAVKSVLVMAGALKRADPESSEDVVLIRAMRDSNVPKFLAEDLPLFNAIVQDLFPKIAIPDADFGELEIAINQSLQEHGLQREEKFVTKVVQLYETLNIRFGVMIVGPTGGGKSTCYTTLAHAMTMLREKESENEQFQKVHTHVLNPKCITMGELYGDVDHLSQEWTDGLASTIMREAIKDTSDDRHWVVFDGPVDSLWIENMNTVLDDNMTLCLVNGERMKLKHELRMVFEVQDLAVASPATVSRCGMVYLTPTDLGYLPYITSWLPQFPEIMRVEHKKFLMDLFENRLVAGLEFLRENLTEMIPTVDINIATSFCSIFEAIFTIENGVDFNDTLEDLKVITEMVFCFAFMWSVGGVISGSDRQLFNKFAGDLFVNVRPPGSVYDHFVDVKNRTWVPWEVIVPDFTYDSKLPYFQMLVPTTDTVKFSTMLQTLLTIDKPVFFTGATGVGKSVIIQSIFSESSEARIVGMPITFSAQTSAKKVQQSIESKLIHYKKTQIGAPKGKKMVIFIDDVNMPRVEVFGAQPPIELLRQFLDYRGFYDRDKLFWKNIVDTTLVCAAAPPGGGRSETTPRFIRHFNVFGIPEPTEAAMTKIFSSILTGFLKDFKLTVQKNRDPMVQSTIELFQTISQELLPTPKKSHYTFNLRDISKVFQGILMIKPMSCNTPEVMVRLWVHESCRCFSDRLVDENDVSWFKKTITSLVTKNFNLPWSEEDIFEKQTIMFGDFFTPGIHDNYEENTRSIHDLERLLDDYLEEYNDNPKHKRMELVFFEDAIMHVARITRILRQPRGNAMLVGVGGSGKQSLTRLACAMAEFECMELSLTRGFGYNEFQEHIKVIMKTAGLKAMDVVFLLTDNQIVDDRFLEDVNNILNSGEVPNLFDNEDMLEIIEEMTPVVRELKLQATRQVISKVFVSRVREHLHIVLGMSPIGDSFRTRCRMFPSLINCCTIDWFQKWPRSALMSVSQRFLHDVELPSDEVRKAISDASVFIHTSVEDACVQFERSLRRHIYTTPKSFLDLVKLYIQLLTEKRDELGNKRDHLRNGLTKLRDSNTVVNSLRETLEELKPVLEQKTKETEELLELVAIDVQKADAVRQVVQNEEKIVLKQAAEVKEVQEDAQADLELALPALRNAVKALERLKKQEIAEVKSMASPPAGVMRTMEAVCILLNQKPDWPTSTKLLARTDFIQLLKNFDKDSIDSKIVKKLQKYVTDPLLTEERMATISKAGNSLMIWCRSVLDYFRVSREVAPKQAKVAEMNVKLKLANDMLHEKQAQLAEVMANVHAVKMKCEETLDEKARLDARSQQTERRLIAAEKLTSSLGTEEVRWRAESERLTVAIGKLVGDVFLSAGIISYVGGFTGDYREKLITSWVEMTSESKIPLSDNFSLINSLGSPVVIRAWNIHGLPTDTVSVNNGIIAMNSQRFPLMIDPQEQAVKWIKNEYKSSLQVTRFTDKNILKKMENCVQSGLPILVEDILETMDPSIDPVCLRSTYEHLGREYIKLVDNELEWHHEFMLFLTTKLPNPHYLPEVQIKINIINFTVTKKGLEDQLLGAVVAKEAPEVEERKDRLVINMANDQKQLADIERRILRLLSESKGNILDDEELITTLGEAKATSNIISVRVEEQRETQTEIMNIRERYRSAAALGSILYFIVAALSLIDPMYQYSLEYFMRLFNLSIDTAAPSDELEERLNNLKLHMTKLIYSNITRGLFESHKLLYSLLIALEIAKSPERNEITQLEFDILLKGVGLIKLDMSSAHPNPFPDIISENNWMIVHHLEREIPAFTGFGNAIAMNSDIWIKYITSQEPHKAKLPGSWEKNLSPFQKMLVLKALNPAKLIFAFSDFVGKQLGEEFLGGTQAKLDDVYNDSDCLTPIIFILSTGADPQALLYRLANEKNYSEKIHSISLGQGQGELAKELVSRCKEKGEWAFLQNCHLAKSWMPELEQIVLNLGSEDEKVHPDFRLWLTSMPATYFPVSVLQRGVKLTNEPPKGIRSNLLRSYTSVIGEDEIESCKKTGPWKKLLFGLAFFFAIIQERKKFGALGWNKSYEFNDSDLETSLTNTKLFLNEQDDIPWDALTYVCGQINFGGRVTDDWDRRCLMTNLKRFLTPNILDDSYRFSENDIYFAPSEGNMSDYVDYLNNLPRSADPTIFGMHENADLTFQIKETQTVLDNVLLIQPREATSDDGKSTDEIVAELAADIERRLPLKLVKSQASPSTFKMRGDVMDSVAIVLLQEMERFNRLLDVMRKTLVDLQKAIRGEVVMSLSLDKMFTSFLINQVPELWTKVSYASLKPLASWFDDLHERVKFMTNWLKNGEPPSFWMSAFFFPQGFLTGVLQNFARISSVAINELSFSYKVMVEADVKTIKTGADIGVYVHGMFFDACDWDWDKKVVTDAKVGDLNPCAPIFQFIPTVNYEPDEAAYECPVYKTVKRAGVLSTTGMSTNFVVSVYLPSDKTPDYWVLKGAALMLTLG